MTELTIPGPPSSTFCASCGQTLVWLYSSTKAAWVAFVPCQCGGRFAIRPHPCRHAQDPRTWRQLDHGDPPSAEYLEFRNKVKSSNEKE